MQINSLQPYQPVKANQQNKSKQTLANQPAFKGQFKVAYLSEGVKKELSPYLLSLTDSVGKKILETAKGVLFVGKNKKDSEIKEILKKHKIKFDYMDKAHVTSSTALSKLWA